MSKSKITIGRSTDCDLVLADLTVSRLHAEIELLENNGLLLSDCQSTQGTFVISNGHEKKIRQQTILNSDLLRFGDITISVREVLIATGLFDRDVPVDVSTQVPDIKLPEYSNSKTDYSCCEGQLAKKSTRLIAAMIDLIVMVFSFIMPFIIASWIGGDLSNTLKTSSGVVGMIALVLLFIVSIQMYLLIKYGQTIGKRALGIKIVNESHEGLPGFVKVILLRSFVPNLLYGIPYAGVAICLADLLFIFRDDRRCLHDLIAQTKVINAANNKSFAGAAYNHSHYLKQNGLTEKTLPIFFGVCFVIWAISQFIAGYDGITSYAGSGWAFGAILVTFIFRFTLPITIGAFYGAMIVWGWPWYLALLFTVPGLVLIVPTALQSVYNFVRDR